MGGKNEAPSSGRYERSQKKLAGVVSDLAEYNIATSKDFVERSDDQFKAAKADYADNKETTAGIVEGQLDIMDDNSAWAKADRERYASVFQPIEDDLVAEMWDYRSDGRRDLEVGRAQSDVAQQFEQARQAATRNLEGYGIDPSATRYAALDLGYRTQQAAASAAAGNEASLQVDETARKLREQAIALGLKYPGMADAASDTAIGAGNAANSNMNQTVATGYETMGTGPQYAAAGAAYTGAANQSLGTQSDVQTAAQKAKLDAYKAEEESTTNWGEIAGMAAGIGAKAYFGAEGGAIPDPEAGAVPPGATPGGAIPMSASASGGEVTDDVDAKLTAGEFVIPVDVVKWKGEEFFQKLIEQARGKNSEAKAKPEEKMAEVGPPTFQSTPSALPAR